MPFIFRSRHVVQVSVFQTAAHYRIAACVIEKDMSTVLTAIMCFLTGPEAFRNASRSVTDDGYRNRYDERLRYLGLVPLRLCKGKNEYSSLKTMTRSTATVVDDWRLFAVVRDPMDRFLSGFVQRCVR